LGNVRNRPEFPAPAVLKHAIDIRVKALIGNRRTVDSPLMYAKAAMLIGTAIVSYYFLVFRAETFLQVAISAVPLALALVGIGFNVQHDGNHGTFSKHPIVNRLAGWTLDLMGASSYFWGDKHNHNHHVYTNIPEEDADIDLGPLARMSPGQPWYWWHQYQHIYLWVLYSLVHFRYLWSDIQRLFLGKADGLTTGYPKGANLAWLWSGKLFFWTVAFVIPFSLHPVGRVLGVYAFVSMTMGIIFAVVFQMAHSVDNVRHPETHDEENRPEWVVHQIETTANFAVDSWAARFLLGGLNYQREHHLYPRIAHVHYPAIAKVVKEVCAEHGVPCHENRTLFEGIRSHYRYVQSMGRKPAAAAVAVPQEA
jgi:linoleoyl-CoA desaturase